MEFKNINIVIRLLICTIVLVLLPFIFIKRWIVHSFKIIGTFLFCSSMVEIKVAALYIAGKDLKRCQKKYDSIESELQKIYSNNK